MSPPHINGCLMKCTIQIILLSKQGDCMTYMNELLRVLFSVIAACPQSFFKKDSRQAGMTFQIAILILFAALLMIDSSFAFADDLDPHYKFSGVKAPDSPYKNTTGAFQTDLFSGSFGYQYKIEVPPGPMIQLPQRQGLRRANTR